MKDDETLLAHLDDAILDDVTELFAIRRAWLDGESDEIYPTHDFYKHPEEFEKFAIAISERCKDFDIYCWILRSPQPSRKEDDVLILIQEGIGYVGDRPIYRLHLCNNWVYKYWKAKAYLTACVAIAWKHEWWVWGREVEPKWLDSVVYGENLIGYDYVCSGFHIPATVRWETDDLVFDPEKYLEYVDEGQFGKRYALETWLHLYDEGFMDLGKHPVVNYRQRFKSALEDL